MAADAVVILLTFLTKIHYIKTDFGNKQLHMASYIHLFKKKEIREIQNPQGGTKF